LDRAPGLRPLPDTTRPVDSESDRNNAERRRARVSFRAAADTERGTASFRGSPVLGLSQGSSRYRGERVLLIAESEMAAALLGTVRFYDLDRGWGFLTPDDGGPDVFVARFQVAAAGLDALWQGDIVEFRREPDAGRGGVRAVALELVEAAPLETGRVRMYDPDRGFGFVVADLDGASIYVGARALDDAGIATLRGGDAVEFSRHDAPRSPFAERLRVLSND
jgi:cold shock protein